MSLFTKGAWRRYNLPSDELRKGWEAITSNPLTLFRLSALVGRAQLVMGGATLDATVGINPPHEPRKDCDSMADQKEVDRYVLPHLVANLQMDECETPWRLPEGAEVPESAEGAKDCWAMNAEDFDLYTRNTGVVGFWIVCWGKQDLEDKPSAREDKAASFMGVPYKLLSSDDRKTLFGDEKFQSTISRKQCPVIMDLNTGDIWLGSGSVKFAKALVMILSVGAGILLTPGELAMGGTTSWVSTALNAIREKDIFRLEREEAIEQEMKAESEHEEDGDPEDPDVQRRIRERADAASDRRHLLVHLAQWAPDEGGASVMLYSEANVSLNPDSKSSVGTAAGRDALELFQAHSKAELQSCLGGIDIMPPTIDDKGPHACTTVDLSAELAQGIYRNLEFASTRAMWNEILEEKYVRGTGYNVVVDSNLPETSYAPRYSRYWFRYYLQLQAFEHHMIRVLALAMDLDPELVAVRSRNLFAEQDKVEAKAAPAAPKSTEVIEDSFLDGIPDVDA